jgi:sugar O-acyltransferase (sialic acid O-acetyltransferase NeuD family)
MKLGVYGSGGLGKEVFELAQRCNRNSNRWEEIVFIDDFRNEGEFFGTKSIRFETLLGLKKAFECVVGIGEPSSREKLFNKLTENSVSLTTIIDPSVVFSATATIGEGTTICEFASIHADVSIGRNCLIQPHCVIGHDTKIGDHTVLSPHCAPGGSSTYGNRVFAGMHSSIKEKLTIGDDVIIAMGAAVFQSLPSGVTVVGNPARITKGHDDRKVFKDS